MFEQLGLSGLVTLILLILFIGVVIWAWSGKRKASFDEASRLPLDEDDEPHHNDNEGQSL